MRVDLTTEIKKWKKNGYQIIVIIDLNEEKTRYNGPFYQMLLNIGLLYIMKHLHPILNPPETYNRGTRTIDAVMRSLSLTKVHRCGWLQFGEGMGDHRIDFLDIYIKYLIKKEKYEIIHSKARRIKTHDNQFVEKYNLIMEKELRKHDILNRLIALKNNHDIITH